MSGIDPSLLAQVNNIAHNAKAGSASEVKSQNQSEKINLSIHDIKDLDKKLNEVQSSGKMDEFLKENFPELSERRKDSITKDNFVNIQSEAILLSHVQIELINHIASHNKEHPESKLDGNKIMGALQNSSAYETFNGQNGLNTKLENYKSENLKDLPKVETGNIDLTVKGNFDEISNELEQHSKKIKEKYGENFNFDSGTNKNVDQIKLMVMSTTPQDLALLKNTYSPRKEGEEPKGPEKEFQIQMTGKESKTKKIGKGAATAITLLATLTVGVLGSIAASAAITALGGGLLATVGIGIVAAAVGSIVLPKISDAINDKISGIGKLEDSNINRNELIESAKKIDTTKYSDLVKNFDELPKGLPKISHETQPQSPKRAEGMGVA